MNPEALDLLALLVAIIIRLLGREDYKVAGGAFYALVRLTHLKLS
jgi:hypothetical protein